MKPWALKCCGCNRLIGWGGKPLATDLSAFMPVAELATFDTKEEADRFATDHGWKAEGGNHRCPECLAKKSKVTQHRLGAYISTATWRR